MPSTNDVRNVNNWVNRAEIECQERWLKHNHLSFSGNILLNKNQEFEGIVIAAPENTPLEKIMKSKEFIAFIMPSIEEALWSVRDIPEEELDDIIEEIRNTRVNLKQKPNEIKKPEVPVMAMNTRQIEKYLPELVDSVYEKHEIKPENKWRKKMENGTIKPPTPPLPGWNNGIIDPNLMWGPGKGLEKGASWLQKLQMYSILKVNGVDPDVFAKTIPEKYVARHFSDEDLPVNARTGKPKQPEKKRKK